MTWSNTLLKPTHKLAISIDATVHQRRHAVIGMTNLSIATSNKNGTSVSVEQIIKNSVRLPRSQWGRKLSMSFYL